MRYLVIGQRQKPPNFSAFHWSPHACLITIGQHVATTRVVHLPKRTETSLITESDQSNYCSYARSAQPGPIRTRLCGPCIAAKAGFLTCVFFFFGQPFLYRVKVSLIDMRFKKYITNVTVRHYKASLSFD